MMENITVAPVTEPENTLNSQKEKIVKPVIFMILALIFGSITSFSGYIIDPIFAKITELIPADSSVYLYYLNNLIYGITKNIFYNITTIFAIAVFFLFAYLAYKNLNKAMRFLGVIFISTTIANFVEHTASTVVSIVENIQSALLSNQLSSVNEQLYSNGITEEEKAALEASKATLESIVENVSLIDLKIFITVVSVIGMVILGIILLLAFEGKFRRKKNNHSKAENAFIKKRFFGLPEILMIAALFTVGALKTGLYVIYFISSEAFSFLCPYLCFKVFYSGSDFYFDMIHPVGLNIINYLYNASDILMLGVLIIFAILAYRKVKGTAFFLGVAFVATKIIQLLFVPFKAIQNAILNCVYTFYFSFSNLPDIEFKISDGYYFSYPIILIAAEILDALVNIALMGITMLLTAAVGIVILMAITGKFKKKPIEIEETYASAETEATETVDELQPVEENN